MQCNSCGALIKQIHDAVGRQANNALRQKDLTLTQLRILMELGNNNGQATPLKELERRFNVAQSTIAGVARRLEAKGLVQRHTNPDDNRVKLVELTDEGKKFRETTINEIEEMDKRLLSPLSEPEQQEFLRMLGLVCQCIKQC